VPDIDINNFVTHQGSANLARDALLPSCEQAVAPTSMAARCWRCATSLSPWARQGFLRHGRVSRWPARVVEPSP
jgi:hypothetical protein